MRHMLTATRHFPFRPTAVTPVAAPELAAAAQLPQPGAQRRPDHSRSRHFHADHLAGLAGLPHQPLPGRGLCRRQHPRAGRPRLALHPQPAAAPLPPARPARRLHRRRTACFATCDYYGDGSLAGRLPGYARGQSCRPTPTVARSSSSPTAAAAGSVRENRPPLADRRPESLTTPPNLPPPSPASTFAAACPRPTACYIAGNVRPGC